MNHFSAKNSALLAEMQELGFSQGLIVIALRFFEQYNSATNDALIYLYENKPNEQQFIEYMAQLYKTQQK